LVGVRTGEFEISSFWERADSREPGAVGGSVDTVTVAGVSVPETVLPKSLKRWAMTPGMAMSSRGERISLSLAPPPPALDRGFMSLVKERRLLPESPLVPVEVDREEVSEMSLIGDLSPLKGDINDIGGSGVLCIEVGTL
jgi:hypothetical protein